MNNVFPKQHFSIPDTLDHDLIKVSFDCAPTRGSVCNKQRHVSSIFMFELDVKQQCLLLSHQPLSVCVCEWVYMHLHVCVCVDYDVTQYLPVCRWAVNQALHTLGTLTTVR